MKVRLVDTFLMMVQLTLAYLLMLIAMAYNGGLFACVILGCGLGHLLFSRPSVSEHSPAESGQCH